MGGDQMHQIWSDAVWGTEMQLLLECVSYTVTELLKLVYKFVTNISVIWLTVFTSKVKITF